MAAGGVRLLIFGSRQPTQPQRSEMLHRVERPGEALDRLAELLDVENREYPRFISQES
jgi:hypothetical protein